MKTRYLMTSLLKHPGFFVCTLLIFVSQVDAQEKSAKVYQAKCASCHGDQGQGVANKFDDPLQGDLTVDELAKYISETMPEEKPEGCVGEEAKQVAQFIYDRFYSQAARGQGARVELSRLTVRQYRESVADLIATFDKRVELPKEQGLEANYFAARGPTEKRRISKQIDPNIDYGDGVLHFDPTGNYEILKKNPKKKGENKMNDGFSAFWYGSIIPPETGNYEIVVQSKNGFRLKINDPENLLIDRRVRSDEVVDHKANIFLLEGRMHFFTLELFSYPDPPAKVRLLWRPPGEPLDVVPASAFVPRFASELAAVPVEFPPDDASYGFERGVDISRSWDEATTQSAIFVADFVAERIWRYAGARPTDEDADKKIREFCYQFVSRALVKKLSDEEKHFFVDKHFEEANSIEDQVKRVVLLTLKSPRFLFPDLQERDDNFELARRMSLTLWDSVPDKRLFELAEAGYLLKKGALNNELARLVEDPRSKQKLRSFFRYWLKTDHASEASKDKKAFPDFDNELVADLKRSLFMQLEETIWSGDSDFRDLFAADYLYVNARLSKFYDLQAELGQDHNEFVKASVDPQQRAGVLTHPYLMTGFAYHKDSSPIHRGVFVAKSLLGRTLRPPPVAVAPLTDEFNPEMTTRERVEHQTKDTACMNCHSVINPLGFSLENFDAVGRFRTEERAKKIDVSSVYKSPDGKQVELNGPRDLAEFLVENEMAQKSFVRQLFNHYAKQPIEAYGPGKLDWLHGRFKENEFNVKKLLIDIALVAINHDRSD